MLFKKKKKSSRDHWKYRKTNVEIFTKLFLVDIWILIWLLNSACSTAHKCIWWIFPVSKEFFWMVNIRSWISSTILISLVVLLFWTALWFSKASHWKLTHHCYQMFVLYTQVLPLEFSSEGITTSIPENSTLFVDMV